MGRAQSIVDRLAELADELIQACNQMHGIRHTAVAKRTVQYVETELRKILKTAAATEQAEALWRDEFDLPFTPENVTLVAAVFQAARGAVDDLPPRRPAFRQEAEAICRSRMCELANAVDAVERKQSTEQENQDVEDHEADGAERQATHGR